MLFIDTETTGLPKNRNSNGLESKGNWPDIVSVSWAIVKDGVKQPTKYFVISPEDWTIPDDSTRIHGITMEDAYAKGVPLRDVLSELSIDLKKVKTLVAHNLEFDKNVLLNA
jgi:DNA polymerase III epsilon subunit-like protein